MSRFAVILTTGNGVHYGYGPIEDPEHARQFAAFLSREVDPAEVVKLIDPIDELLAFHRRNHDGDERTIGWPPKPGDIWQDKGGDRWACTRTNGPNSYLTCLARVADDNAEEIWRQHGPMTYVASIPPTKDEEPPF